MSEPGERIIRHSGERVSLEQLLAETGEPDQPAPRRPRRRWPWLADPLVAVVVAAAIFAVLRVFSFVVPYIVLLGTVLAVLALRRVFAVVRIEGPPAVLHSPAWGVVDDIDRFAPVDGVVRVVRRWEGRFSWTERDHVRYATAVRPRLVELVDERLRQRHGITLHSDPARARTLLGDPLSTFLHAPVRRGPSPREMAAMVAEMEKI